MSFGGCTSQEYLQIFLCGSVTSVPLCAFVVKKETPQKHKRKQGLIVVLGNLLIQFICYEIE